MGLVPEIRDPGSQRSRSWGKRKKDVKKRERDTKEKERDDSRTGSWWPGDKRRTSVGAVLEVHTEWKQRGRVDQ